MMSLSSTLMVWLTYTLVFYLNPVKMGICLLLISTIMLLIMLVKTSMVLVPMVFYLLFMGGILILFMIISSTTPNEKSLKMNMNLKNLSFIVLLCFLCSSSLFLPNNLMTPMSKWMLNSNLNFISITTLVTMYFLVFMKLLSKSKGSLRTQIC